MTLTYDPRYNIAYLRLREKTGNVESIRVSDELVVDMTPDGAVYGFELLNANEQLRNHLGKLLFVNEASGDKAKIELPVVKA